MKSEIAEGDELELENQKQWLYDLFFYEENVVQAFRIGEIFKVGDKVFSAKKVDELIEKKAMGIAKRLLEDKPPVNAFLIYHNLDERLGPISSHPLVPELYFELKHAGHREEDMQELVKSVISTYEKLSTANKCVTHRIRLARAIALTCRGKYQCPTNMRKYFKIGGGPAKIQAAGEAVGEELNYNPRRLLKSWILKAQKKFEVGEEFEQEVMRLRKNDRTNPIASPAYISALAYLALTSADSKVAEKITQQEVAGFFGVTDEGLRINVHKYCDGNNFPYRSHTSSPKVFAIMEEFKMSLGYMPHLRKPKPNSLALQEYEKLKEVVRFLLDKKHFANNPIPEEELIKKFVSEGDSYARASRLLQTLSRQVSPVKCYMQSSGKTFEWRKASYYLGLDEERSKAWFNTMDEFISFSKG